MHTEWTSSSTWAAIPTSVPWKSAPAIDRPVSRWIRSMVHNRRRNKTEPHLCRPQQMEPRQQHQLLLRRFVQASMKWFGCACRPELSMWTPTSTIRSRSAARPTSCRHASSHGKCLSVVDVFLLGTRTRSPIDWATACWCAWTWAIAYWGRPSVLQCWGHKTPALEATIIFIDETCVCERRHGCRLDEK